MVGDEGKGMGCEGRSGERIPFEPYKYLGKEVLLLLFTGGDERLRTSVPFLQ